MTVMKAVSCSVAANSGEGRKPEQSPINNVCPQISGADLDMCLWVGVEVGKGTPLPSSPGKSRGSPFFHQVVDFVRPSTGSL